MKSVKKPKLGIVGLGMVGEPLMRYFELKGFKRGSNLFCYDTDPKKDYADDITKADIVFVSVPSPRNSDGSCNTNIVESVIKEYADKNKVFVVKSTVEPGFCARLAKKYKVPILFNPEFLTEARAWEDMINPDRQIVAHTVTAKRHASHVLGLLPEAFFSSPGTLGTYTFTRLNSTEAEIGKYAGNLFGALKVTYGNVLADFCEALEKSLRKEGIKTAINYNHVRHAVAHDKRIGDSWLDVHHGDYRGYGGYCFPKDVDALIATMQKTIKKLPLGSAVCKRLEKGTALLMAMRDYNTALLASQGFTPEGISMHDHEVAELLESKKQKYGKRKK